MMNSRTVGIALAVAAAIIGAYFFLQAAVPVGTTIHLSVDTLDVEPPTTITGLASVDPEDDVEVFAEIDGVPIPGFPDFDMEGPVNEFTIPVTEDMRGRTIVVTACTPDGSQRQVFIHVR